MNPADVVDRINIVTTRKQAMGGYVTNGEQALCMYKPWPLKNKYSVGEDT